MRVTFSHDSNISCPTNRSETVVVKRASRNQNQRLQGSTRFVTERKRASLFFGFSNRFCFEAIYILVISLDKKFLFVVFGRTFVNVLFPIYQFCVTSVCARFSYRRWRAWRTWRIGYPLKFLNSYGRIHKRVYHQGSSSVSWILICYSNVFCCLVASDM